MEDISIKRRRDMVRSLREAGLTFEEIVTILRTGNRRNEQACLWKNSTADMPDTDWLHETPAL